MQYTLALILLLFVISAVLRLDFYFYLLYAFFGVYFFSRLWAERALRGLVFERNYTDRAFPGEHVTVTLRIRHRGWLPLPWLRVHESLPIELHTPNFFRCVLSLWPREETVQRYDLECRRRGYYPLGPLLVSAGDLFGVRSSDRRLERDDALTVYPRIVPLADLGLPAQTPFGAVPVKQRIYEDPSRLLGVREYQSGDSLRHMHWKATAATGALQVKRFEPAISIEAQILLNLDRRDYSTARAITASELAVVTAASIAHYLVEGRQAVGLITNGLDPLQSGAQMPLSLPARKGRAHLMRLLDVLARAQVGEGTPFGAMLHEVGPRLTWGGTTIVIAPHVDDDLFDRLLAFKRRGFYIVLIVVDPRTPFDLIRRRARAAGIVAYQVWQERDLDVWRTRYANR
ncbi:MAG TPA: DUF58 domain-containing protein [Chloroflexi bacterium]|jgi:uncharacterized protein (DUF58 family)|nr:DUF58 domain-containing protein [Chloroflexota bacterium]